MCGRAEEANGFVDTSMEVDFVGAIQVCYRCVVAMHDVFGFDATARSIINEDAVANVHHLLQVVTQMKVDYEKQLSALINHIAGLDRSFDKSYELLVQAAGAREAAIVEANQRAAESLGFDELGLDSDVFGAESKSGRSSSRS